MQSYLKKILDAVSGLYARVFSARDDETAVEFVNVLREVSLFQTLTRRQLLKLAPAFHRRHYKRDEVIYFAGDPGLGLYVVESGTVTLNYDQDNGSTEVAELASRDTFGVVSMLGDIRRQETARALTQTSLLGLFSPELKSIIRRNPSLGAAVLLVLTQHIASRHVTFAEEITRVSGGEEANKVLASLNGSTAAAENTA